MTRGKSARKVALRCQKCGLRLWMRASDVTFAPDWSGQSVAHLGEAGVAGEPLSCPAHPGSTYFLGATEGNEEG